MDLTEILFLILYYFTTGIQVTEGAQRSCYDHLVNNRLFGVTPPDGEYNVTINGVVTPVYCDMTTDGGGWTLLVAMVEGLNWNYQNILERNEQMPSLSVDYSILGKADFLKENARGEYFQYAMEATGRRRWGGTFSAPNTYSLVNYYPNQTHVQLLTKYDQWEFAPASIGKRVPWLDTTHRCAILTTRSPDSTWYGTLVMKHCTEWDQYGPSAWLISGSTYVTKAKPIYYWLRENAPVHPEVPTLLPISEADVTRRKACDHVTRLVDKDLQTGLTLPGREGPGCTASFTINTPTNNISNINLLVRVFGKNLGHENLLVGHADQRSQSKGLFKLGHVIKDVTWADELDFHCNLATPNVLHLIVFAKEQGVKVTEIAVVRIKG